MVNSDYVYRAFLLNGEILEFAPCFALNRRERLQSSSITIFSRSKS
jgi:hypothetical protein